MKNVFIFLTMSLATAGSAFANQSTILLNCNNGALTVEVSPESPLILIHDVGVVNYIRSRGIQSGQILSDGTLRLSGLSYWQPGELKRRTYYEQHRLYRKGPGAQLSLSENPTHGGDANMWWYFESCQGTL